MVDGFGSYVAPVKENEYKDIVAQLINMTKGGDPNASYTFTVEANKETSAALAFQQAANAQGATARKRNVDTSNAVYTPRVDSNGNPVMTKQGKTQKIDASGTVTLTFTIANEVAEDGTITITKHDRGNGRAATGKSKK